MGFKINLFIFVVFSMFSMGYLCVPKSSSPDELRPICKLPYNVGHYIKPISKSKVFPRLEQKRFWFSKEAKNCVPFDYKGCGGNGNNFKTYEECTKACNITYLQ